MQICVADVLAILTLAENSRTIGDRLQKPPVATAVDFQPNSGADSADLVQTLMRLISSTCGLIS